MPLRGRAPLPAGSQHRCRSIHHHSSSSSRRMQALRAGNSSLRAPTAAAMQGGRMRLAPCEAAILRCRTGEPVARAYTLLAVQLHALPCIAVHLPSASECTPCSRRSAFPCMSCSYMHILLTVQPSADCKQPQQPSLGSRCITQMQFCFLGCRRGPASPANAGQPAQLVRMQQQPPPIQPQQRQQRAQAGYSGSPDLADTWSERDSRPAQQGQYSQVSLDHPAQELVRTSSCGKRPFWA